MSCSCMLGFAVTETFYGQYTMLGFAVTETFHGQYTMLYKDCSGER